MINIFFPVLYPLSAASRISNSQTEKPLSGLVFGGRGVKVTPAWWHRRRARHYLDKMSHLVIYNVCCSQSRAKPRTAPIFLQKMARTLFNLQIHKEACSIKYWLDGEEKLHAALKPFVEWKPSVSGFSVYSSGTLTPRVLLIWLCRNSTANRSCTSQTTEQRVSNGNMSVLWSTWQPALMNRLLALKVNSLGELSLNLSEDVPHISM